MTPCTWVVIHGHVMNIPYRHTQAAGAWRWFLLPAALLPWVLTRLWVATIPALVVWLVLYLFGSLTITVDADRLAWWFGPGLVRKNLPLREVAASEAVTTTFFDGWGIHYTLAHGWLYNVAGFAAVAIRTHGGRRLALGTDDPSGLVAALSRAAGGASTHATPQSR